MKVEVKETCNSCLSDENSLKSSYAGITENDVVVPPIIIDPNKIN